MPNRERKNIRAGLKVAIVLKQDQRTGKPNRRHRQRFADQFKFSPARHQSSLNRRASRARA